MNENISPILSSRVLGNQFNLIHDAKKNLKIK